MQTVTFYTKLDCGLCDQAYQMLMDIAIDHPLEIDVLDITHTHNHLEAEYKDRIPVISVPNADTELAWPFTPDDISAYLNLM